MRLPIARFALAVVFAVAPLSFAQTAGQDMKQAGKDVKEAGKETGKATAKTANKAAKKVEQKTQDKQ
jgi:predicted small secreted protein